MKYAGGFLGGDNQLRPELTFSLFQPVGNTPLLKGLSRTYLSSPLDAQSNARKSLPLLRSLLSWCCVTLQP